jgi:hypothetical protein
MILGDGSCEHSGRAVYTYDEKGLKTKAGMNTSENGDDLRYRDLHQ